MKELQQLLGQPSKVLYICFQILVYLTAEFPNGCYKESGLKEQCNSLTSQLLQKGSEPKMINFLTLQISYSPSAALARELPEYLLEILGLTKA